jgi:hypothetical protein
VKSLIAITALTALMIMSSSIAQCDEKGESALLAKAESGELSISKITNAHENIKSSMEIESIRNGYSDKENSFNQGPRHSRSLSLRDGSRDISSLIKNELSLERSLDLDYNSPKLKAEQMPLVMSSKNKKTKGAVFPLFFLLKKQF